MNMTMTMSHIDLNLVNEKLSQHTTNIIEISPSDEEIAESHPFRPTLTPQITSLILTHWDFDSESEKQTYLQRDLTGLACLAYPFALDDRIELIARLFSIVYLLGELISDLGIQDGEECLESLQEAVKGYWQPDPDQAAVWMLCGLFDEIRFLDYACVDGIVEGIWRFLDLRIVQRGRRIKRGDDEMKRMPFQDAFLAAGMELPLHRFATGIMIDEEEFRFGAERSSDDFDASSLALKEILSSLR